MKKLFVFLRSDLASMSPGKAAAQVAHAASQAAWLNMVHEKTTPWYVEWANSALRCIGVRKYPDEHYIGFGTTIVLDAGTGEQMDRTISKLLLMVNNGMCGTVVDPTYPVRDGTVTHAIDIPTCGWLLYEGGDTDIDLILKEHKLYNGNNV